MHVRLLALTPAYSHTRPRHARRHTSALCTSTHTIYTPPPDTHTEGHGSYNAPAYILCGISSSLIRFCLLLDFHDTPPLLEHVFNLASTLNGSYDTSSQVVPFSVFQPAVPCPTIPSAPHHAFPCDPSLSLYSTLPLCAQHSATITFNMTPAPSPRCRPL